MAKLPDIVPPIVFRNYKAVAAWIFMALWMAGLGCFTWLGIRDGGMPGWGPHGTAALLCLFWVFGIGGCAYCFGMPCIRLRITATSVEAREGRPGHTETHRCTPAEVAVPEVVETKDDEGDPYFRCDIELPGGKRVTVVESHARDEVEATRARLLSALAASPPASP